MAERILLIGSGGREHALAWKIARSPALERLDVAPGSDAIAGLAACHTELAADDVEGIVELARELRATLVVVGPEAPLAAGLADALERAGIACFGPAAAAARLESSKRFAKEFMARHGIPTAGFAVFDAFEAARDHARALGGPCVVKADGLAAGKGVAVCDGSDDAESALAEMMRDRRFGEAGDRVVIEERLEGEEASYYAITDGEHVVTLAAAQDHKRALDGDHGENTGGMGAYSPAPVLTDAVEKRVLEEIVHPTIRGLAAEGSPYRGVLYVGLMIDAAGAPRVIEYNARFGDPEMQPLVLRMEGDLVPLLVGAARGGLENAPPLGFRDAAVCVVLASEGYPRAYPKGRPIRGLAEAESDPDVVVFHAGTQLVDADFHTRGGRVLGVTARGSDVADARARAYAAADAIAFEGAQRRSDIAARAVGR